MSDEKRLVTELPDVSSRISRNILNKTLYEDSLLIFGDEAQFGNGNGIIEFLVGISYVSLSDFMKYKRPKKEPELREILKKNCLVGKVDSRSKMPDMLVDELFLLYPQLVYRGYDVAAILVCGCFVKHCMGKKLEKDKRIYAPEIKDKLDNSYKEKTESSENGKTCKVYIIKELVGSILPNRYKEILSEGNSFPFGLTLAQYL